MRDFDQKVPKKVKVMVLATESGRFYARETKKFFVTAGQKL